MVNIYTEIIINTSLEKVAEYAVNPDNAPEWYDNIQSAIWITPKPLVIGTKIDFVAHFLGRKLAYTYEIVEFEQRKKLVMCTAEGPFPMETTYIWEKIDDNTTKMSLRNKGIPSGFSKLFAPFMAVMMKRANTKDLNKVKKILENE